jgi:uncharacterized iron-regulated membrane protein
MAGSTTLKLRGVWFQIHKWIGILLAVLLIPLSLTGSALVWHDGLEKLLYPQRFAVSGSDTVLAPSAYIAAARPRLDANDRISAVRFGKNGEPVVVTAVRAPADGSEVKGRPLRTSVWLDPARGTVVDVADGNSGIIRTLHVLHGSLMIPGVGRQIVGWLGVAMLISCLSGIWLWWPTVGRWAKGLRWRRSREFDTNLHHLTGFWVSIPLAMLCFTGVWISFPAFFGALSGEPPRTADRMAAMRALPLESPQHQADAVLAAAAAKAGKAALLSMEFPTDRPGPWKVGFAGEEPTAFTVDDVTGSVASEASRADQRPAGLARTMRQWHDGTGMGLVWQIVIFIGGLIPAALGITGITMWLRTRTWRAAAAARREGPAPAPAE